MTARKSQRFATSRRARYTRVTPTICALLLSLAGIAAQQPSAPAHIDASPVPAAHERVPGDDQGPLLSSSEIAQGAILLHFTHADGGLRLKDSGRGAFQIAGADHSWFPADAHVVNGIVVVSTSLVQQPTAVRYSWSTFAAATLFNGAGQPAVPFTTDK